MRVAQKAAYFVRHSAPNETPPERGVHAAPNPVGLNAACRVGESWSFDRTQSLPYSPKTFANKARLSFEVVAITHRISERSEGSPEGRGPVSVATARLRPRFETAFGNAR